MDAVSPNGRPCRTHVRSDTSVHRSAQVREQFQEDASRYVARGLETLLGGAVERTVDTLNRVILL